MLHCGGEIEIKDIQPAKQEGGPNTGARTPDRKDHECNGKPASVTESIVAPDAAGVIHYVIKAAETGNHAADAGRHIFITGNIDACCICCGRTFPDGAKMQSDSCLFQKVRGNQCQKHRNIGQEAVREEQLSKPPQRRSKGKRGFINKTCAGQHDRRHRGFGELDQGTAEEIAETNAEGRHGKAGNILVGTERDGQKTVKKPHQQRSGKAAQKRDQQSKEIAELTGCRSGLFIEE